MPDMKLPPQAPVNKGYTSEDMMLQMAALLSEKDDIIEQKSDVIAEQKKRIAMLEEPYDYAERLFKSVFCFLQFLDYSTKRDLYQRWSVN